MQQSSPIPDACGDVGERAVAVVVEQLVGLERAADEQVLEAVVVVVGKDGDTHAVQPRKARLRGDVLKRAVAAIAKEPRGNPIGDKQIVETVIVVVDHRYSAGAVADHSELQGLRQERGVVLIDETNASDTANVLKMSFSANNAFTFNQRLVAYLQDSVVDFPRDSEVCPVDPGRSDPVLSTYQLETNSCQESTRLTPFFDPVHVEGEHFQFG